MLTRTFRLQYENAVNLIPVLRPIVSPNNPINAYPGNNTIVVTDYAENLTRVAQLIQTIDTPSAIDTDVVQIQNGIAADIAPMVADLLDAPGNDPTQKIAVIGDPRSNTIIIRAGSPERTELARNLIYKLDNAQSNPSNLHVVYLRNAQAAKLAQALRGLLTGESDSGTSDSARSVLSAMGSNGNNNGGQNAQSGTQTSGTPRPRQHGQHRRQLRPGQQFAPAAAAIRPANRTLRSAPAGDDPGGRHHQHLADFRAEPLYRNLREVIDLLDQRRAQVVIESLIVEVGEDDASEFGVQWQTGNLGGKGGSAGRTWAARGSTQRQDQPRRAAAGLEPRLCQRHRRHPRHRQDPRPESAGPGAEEQGRHQRAVDAEPADPGQRGGEHFRRPDHSVCQRQLRHRRRGPATTRSRP
jgi:general secretion pathway protein D